MKIIMVMRKYKSCLDKNDYLLIGDIKINT